MKLIMQRHVKNQEDTVAFIHHKVFTPPHLQEIAVRSNNMGDLSRACCYEQYPPAAHYCHDDDGMSGVSIGSAHIKIIIQMSKNPSVQ